MEYRYTAETRTGLTYVHTAESVEHLQTFRALDIEAGLKVTDIEPVIDNQTEST